jgi:hypothetical protein
MRMGAHVPADLAGSRAEGRWVAAALADGVGEPPPDRSVPQNDRSRGPDYPAPGPIGHMGPRRKTLPRRGSVFARRASLV